MTEFQTMVYFARRAYESIRNKCIRAVGVVMLGAKRAVFTPTATKNPDFFGGLLPPKRV